MAINRPEIEIAAAYLLDSLGAKEWSDERRFHLAVLEGFVQGQRDALSSADPPQFGTAAWADGKATP